MYLNYCRGLRFEEGPDYMYLRQLFRILFKPDKNGPEYKAVVAARFGSTPQAMAASPDLTRMVHEQHAARVATLLDEAVAGGAKVLQGGTHDAAARWVAPTLVSDVPDDSRLAREEIFGPVAALLVADGYEHALALANDTKYGLCAGVCTSSLKHATHFKRHAQAGMVMVNLPTAGVDYHVPFGGRKASSHGPREQGRHAAEFYTTVKTAYTYA